MATGLLSKFLVKFDDVIVQEQPYIDNNGFYLDLEWSKSKQQWALCNNKVLLVKNDTFYCCSPYI
jgi:hypothetical protein